MSSIFTGIPRTLFDEFDQKIKNIYIPMAIKINNTLQISKNIKLNQIGIKFKNNIAQINITFETGKQREVMIINLRIYSENIKMMRLSRLTMMCIPGN